MKRATDTVRDGTDDRGEGSRRVDRRNLLRLGGMTAAGAAGAMLVSAANASPAAASNGVVALGADNTGATARTAIIADLDRAEVAGFFNDADHGAAVRGRAGADSGAWPDAAGTQVGVFGESYVGTGVWGESYSSPGVVGRSQYGTGMTGISQTFTGVYASGATTGVDAQASSGPAMNAHIDVVSNGSSVVEVSSAGSGAGIDVAANGDAIRAHSTGGNNGVYALNGTSTGIGGPAGVYGDSHDATGILGTSIAQIGVRGLHGGYSGQESLGGFDSGGFAGGVVGEDAATGVGVVGASPNGVGIDGLSTAGTAVKATTSTGIALDVHGKAQFNRSGVVAIAGTATSAVVTIPGKVTKTSLILAVLQTDQPGVWVASAVPNVPKGKATINLNVAPGTGKTVNVAWFVIG